MTNFQILCSGKPVYYTSLLGDVQFEATWSMDRKIGLSVLIIRQRIGNIWKRVHSSAMTEAQAADFCFSLDNEYLENADGTFTVC